MGTYYKCIGVYAIDVHVYVYYGKNNTGKESSDKKGWLLFRTGCEEGSLKCGIWPHTERKEEGEPC